MKILLLQVNGMLFAANIAVEQEVIAADIVLAFSYLHAFDVHQHQAHNQLGTPADAVACRDLVMPEATA